jgi:hypothetical protein
VIPPENLWAWQFIAFWVVLVVLILGLEFAA